MVNAQKIFKEDEARDAGVPSNQNMRDLTGIREDEEQAMDQSARRGNDSSTGSPTANSKDLASQESSGGFYKSSKGGESPFGRSLAQSPNGKESDGGLFKPESNKLNPFMRFMPTKRRGLMGIVVGLLLGAGGIYGVGEMSGPAMVVQASQVLQKPSAKSVNDTSIRTGRLFRFLPPSAASDVGLTRMGIVGRSVFGKTMSDLNKSGITFERSSSGAPTKTTFDLDKLRKSNKSFKGLSDAEATQALSKTLGVPESALGGSGGTRFLDESGIKTAGYDPYNLKTSRLLTRNTMSLVGDGKILSAIKFRYLSKALNLPSLFHPLDRKLAEKQNTVAAAERKKIADDEEKAKLTEVADAADNVETLGESTGKEAVDKVKSETGGVKGAINAVNVQGAVCEVKKISDEIPALDRARVVVPAVIMAARLIAVGEQVRNGESDVTMEQLGGIVNTLYDASGTSIFAGQAFQALETNGKSNDGPDILPEYRDGFRAHTTVNAINSFVTKLLGGNTSSAVACNEAVMAVEGVATIVVSVASDGAAMTVIQAARLALQVGLDAAKTAVFMHFLESFILDSTTAKELGEKAFVGALGGNNYAYGAMSAANMAGLANGGVESSTTKGVFLGYNSTYGEAASTQSFASRIFDAYDYQTPAGAVARATAGGPAAITSHLANTLLSMPKTMTNAFGSLFPRALAADEPYDWGFPQVGLPESLLNDSRLADPYDNAAKLVPILQNNTNQVIERAYNCFGAQISNANSDTTWDVQTTISVDPNSQTYIDANCNPFGDQGMSADVDWARVVMFVFDTKTMKAVGCYDGDVQSCTDLGIGGPAPLDSNVASTSSVDQQTMYDDSSKISCYPGTTEGGIQDGYHEDASGTIVKIPIHLCGIPGIPSTSKSSESYGGYGSTYTDGDALVNARVSGNFYALAIAAQKDGVRLSAESSFRTMEHQKSLCPCDGVNVATPGTSNHQMGLAIDFNTGGVKQGSCAANRSTARGDPMWDWLNNHAAGYGIKQYGHEAWHWDTLSGDTRCGGDGT